MRSLHQQKMQKCERNKSCGFGASSGDRDISRRLMSISVLRDRFCVGISAVAPTFTTTTPTSRPVGSLARAIFGPGLSTCVLPRELEEKLAKLRGSTNAVGFCLVTQHYRLGHVKNCIFGDMFGFASTVQPLGMLCIKLLEAGRR